MAVLRGAREEKDQYYALEDAGGGKKGCED